MINTILSDFSRVILFPKDTTFKGKLNDLHKELSETDSNYPFFDYFEFNKEILDLFRRLRKKYFVNVFTSGSIQNRPEVRRIIDPIFENIYTAKDYNLDKKTPEAYLVIVNKLGKRPSEVIFIDDKMNNIKAAQKAGLHTIQYSFFEDLVLKLKKYL